MKFNAKNERMKHKFIENLRNKKGRSESTITAIEHAVNHYQEALKNEAFERFNHKRAIQFKEWLAERRFNNKPLSLTTQSNYLRHVRTFFEWLGKQPGFKSKINFDDIEYLRLTAKEERIATQAKEKDFPDIQYVRELTASIEINCEIDQRDRALIAFTALTGIRDSALASLPLECIDMSKMVVDQDPKKGVNTKNSKHIITVIFQYENQLVAYVKDWVKHLREKSFDNQCPLFPSAKPNQGKDKSSFEPSKEVQPEFWQTAGSIRKIFNQRAQEAGLRYYNPHAFRDTAIVESLKYAKTGQHIKAISQNFGHENVATTFECYGNFKTSELIDIINNLDYSNSGTEITPEQIKQIKNILFDNKHKTL